MVGERLDIRSLGELDFKSTLVIILSSSVFGLVVAAGTKKGSLIRHFVYGVILPTPAYSLAGMLLRSEP